MDTQAVEVCLLILLMLQCHVNPARLIPSIPDRPSRLNLMEVTEDTLTCSLSGSPPFAASMKILQLLPGGEERYLASMATSIPAALSRDALTYFPDAQVSGDWNSRTMTLSLHPLAVGTLLVAVIPAGITATKSATDNQWVKGRDVAETRTYRCDVYCYDDPASSRHPSKWSRLVLVTHQGGTQFASDPPGFDVTSETQFCLQSTAQKHACCGSHNYVIERTSTSDVTEAYEVRIAEEVTKLMKTKPFRKAKQGTTGVTEPSAVDDADNISDKKDDTDGDSDNIRHIDTNIVIDDREHNIKNMDSDIQISGNTSEGQQAGASAGGSVQMGVNFDACPFGDLEWSSIHLKSPQGDYACTRTGQGTTWHCDLQKTKANHDSGSYPWWIPFTIILSVIVGITVLVGGVVVVFLRRRSQNSYQLRHCGLSPSLPADISAHSEYKLNRQNAGLDNENGDSTLSISKET